MSLANQYPFIFPLNCGQRLNTDRPIEIDLFGRSERLAWATKQSSDRPTNNIRHVKYFAQKPRRQIDSSVTLDVQGSIFIVGSQKNIMSAHCRVISESQRPNFGRQSYFLLNFKAILCFNWSLHCTVVFAQKLLLATNYEITGLVVSQSGALFKLVAGYWSVHPTDQKYLVIGVYSKDSSPRGTGP